MLETWKYFSYKMNKKINLVSLSKVRHYLYQKVVGKKTPIMLTQQKIKAMIASVIIACETKCNYQLNNVTSWWTSSFCQMSSVCSPAFAKQHWMQQLLAASSWLLYLDLFSDLSLVFPYLISFRLHQCVMDIFRGFLGFAADAAAGVVTLAIGATRLAIQTAKLGNIHCKQNTRFFIAKLFSPLQAIATVRLILES